MADYNIYIHAIGTGGATNQSPTTPWSQKSEGESGGAFSQTQSQTSGNVGGGGFNAVKAITKAASVAQNPDSVISAAFVAAAKFVPWVAAAYACVRLGVAIADNVLEFQALETGYYGNQIKWQDWKQGVRNIFHPFSSGINALKTQRQWAIENQKLTQQRDLLGDSVINSYTGRGV